MEKNSKYKLSLDGSGLTFKRDVSEFVVRAIMDLVLKSENVENIPHSTAQESSSQLTSAHSEASRSGLSPKQFMIEKNPKTDMQKIACLAFYLEHYRNVSEFKTRDLTLLHKETAQPKLSNFPAAVKNAATYDYLTPASSGKKRLSTVGEDIVEVLPDLAKAKEIADKSKRKQYGKREKKS